MAALNPDDADAAFLNAMKALQELENTQNAALGGESDNRVNERAESLGAKGVMEIGSEMGDGARELSAHEEDDEVEEDEEEHDEDGEDDEEEDNLLKTPASEEVSPAASLPPAAAVSSPKTGPSSVDTSTNGKESAPHHDHSTVDVGATQESSARSPSAAPARGDSATVDDGAYVPDEDISDRTPPPPMSIDTNTNAGSHNVDSLPVSASVPSPPVSALSTVPAPVVSAQNTTQKVAPAFTSNKRKRLPQDIVGQLEDRIAEDAKGDIDAWLALIEEHRKKGKLDDARAVYERFFVVFPAVAQQWIAYVKMELANNELTRVEQIFFRSLLNVPNVELWSLYLDYIRRRNNLTTDTGGKARAIVSQAYEFVLNTVGCDREAGKIWSDHVQFIKNGPGNVGGSGWQDQQKMDSLRKVYQKAVTMPVQGVELLWREYDQFEQGLNKLTARKFLQERSPLFMTARSCLIELTNTTKGLRRETLPRLPPAPGYDGYEDWIKQVGLWKKWIQWEKDDPLVLAKDDPAGLRTRILYVFKQALMALRFWPEIWFDAAEWCFANGMDDQGVEFLKHGMVANPESCLLHFKYAERLEATIPVEGGEDALVRKGQMIRKPYDDLLNVLYSQVSKVQQREKEELAKLEEGYQDSQQSRDDDDYDDPDAIADKSAKESQVAALKESSKAQILVMSKTISAVWVNLMRAMRRVQGHGKVNEPLGGSRQIFADARKRGKITSDVYVASALIEFHCYKDPAALKIFERGMKLFPEDEEFALEYLKHLIANNDITNARAVFETFVGKAPAQKTKKIYQYFYEYEAHYGDLNQVYKLEKRMSELFPSDPYLNRFSTRYSYKSVDPCSYIPVISPNQQCRPKSSGRQDMPQEYNQTDSRQSIQVTIPNGRIGASIASPKRAANEDLSDSSEHRPRKVMRPDSPLKGAAGRRLDQQKRVQQQQQQHNRDRGGMPDREATGRDDGGRGGYQRQQHQGRPQQQQQQQQQQPMHQPPPAPPPAPTLPDMVMYLLSILPGAQTYQAVRFRPEAMVGLLANVQLPRDAQSSQSYAYPR